MSSWNLYCIANNSTSRIDLHPAAPVGEGEGGGDSTTERRHGSTPTPMQEASQPRAHRGLAGYLQEALNVRRMLDASPEERLQVLRNVRNVRREEGDGEETAEERRGHRLRLTSRLRDRFRIRTRQHGEDE